MMRSRAIPSVVVTLLLAAAPSYGQTAPKCIGLYEGVYVEGTVQLLSSEPPPDSPPDSPLDSPSPSAPPAPCKVKSKVVSPESVDANGWPKKPVNGKLVVPTNVPGDFPGNSLRFYVQIDKKSWRAVSIPYNQITSLAYGFIPQGPILSTNGATIIGTSVSASTAVLAISSGINSTWKASLGATGVGIAALLGLTTAYRAGIPLKRTRRKEWYYLVVGFNANTTKVADERREAVKWDYSKTYYSPQGSLAVFKMQMQDFWPLVLLLQSGTGLPLGALPTPGQSAK